VATGKGDTAMALGPIELFVIGFPENNFTGQIQEKLQDLIDQEIITLVDGLFITKDSAGEVTCVEIEQVDVDESIAQLASFLEDGDGLLNEEDVDDIGAGLEPDSSALALIFEHTWIKPVRDAVFDAGGVVMANVRVPGAVVNELLAESASS
jgi:uncharacterized membrane protein